jgi:hypothetical protein
MTGMWKRGSQCHHHVTATAAACLPYRLPEAAGNAVVWPEHQRLNSGGSPP